MMRNLRYVVRLENEVGELWTVAAFLTEPPALRYATELKMDRAIGERVLLIDLETREVLPS